MVPSKSVSSPAMMRSIVVLPHPEGPTRAATWRCPSLKLRSRKTSKRSPEADVKALCAIRTSTCPNSPARGTSFKGLHHCCFYNKNDGDECERISKDKRNVKQLERHTDLKSYAIRPPKQFHDEDDLPDQRKAGTSCCSEIGSELRQDHVPQVFSARQSEDGCHFVKARNRARVRPRAP